MKTSIKTIAATIALTALMAGPASAMISQGSVSQDVHSALSAGSNVFVNVKGDAVTLTGYFQNTNDRNVAIQAAKASTGVERVIDLTTLSN